VLEATFPGAAGSILHFYAVAAYNLQHPDSIGLTAKALQSLRHNLADVLDGKLSLELLRRQGEPPVDWYRGPWKVNVVDVLTATAASYPDLVEDWARGVRGTLDAQHKRPDDDRPSVC